VQLIIDGKVAAACECSPKFGPKAFDTAVAYANGDVIEAKLINPDRFFDATNAATELATAF
jgi:galactofuranose transport system substrate-binding protein